SNTTCRWNKGRRPIHYHATLTSKGGWHGILALLPGRHFIRTIWSVRKPCTQFLLRCFRIDLCVETFQETSELSHLTSHILPEGKASVQPGSETAPLPNRQTLRQDVAQRCPDVPPQIIDELFAQLDDDYFALYSASQIAAHVRLLAAVDEPHP